MCPDRNEGWQHNHSQLQAAGNDAAPRQHGMSAAYVNSPGQAGKDQYDPGPNQHPHWAVAWGKWEKGHEDAECDRQQNENGGGSLHEVMLLSLG
jgi:hypothetical protein